MAITFSCLQVVLGAILAVSVSADEARDLKVFAKVGFSNSDSTIGPLRPRPHLVIRSAEELAFNKDPKKGKDPAFQKEVETQLAKLLKVDAIDWNKQMVVAVWYPVEPQRVGLPPVDFVSFKVQGNQLAVSWALKGASGGCSPSPIGVALIERFDGQVLFNSSAKK